MNDQEILENLNWRTDGRLTPDELQMVLDQISQQLQHRMLEKKKLSPEVIVAITQLIVEDHLYTKVLYAAMPQARTYEREKVIKEIFEVWQCKFIETAKRDCALAQKQYDERHGRKTDFFTWCNRCKMRLKLMGL
jgi:hypothetical protein